jgi:microcystin-dependent protein
MAFYSWSKTAATNANADPSVNYQEGQAPSSLNDSARAAMARLAEYRDDISGLVQTGGTSSVYTAASNQGMPATPVDGQMFSFTPHVVNAANPFLQVDGGNAYALTGGGLPLPAGTLANGTPYTVKFSLTFSAWVLRDFYTNPYNVPIGSGMLYFGAATPNSNFAFADGSALSRTTYATLFSLCGTAYGIGDGSTTFNLPNLKGRVPAGRETVATLLSAAFFGADSTGMGSLGGSDSHTLTTAQIPSITPAGTISAITPSGTISQITPAGTITDGAITISGGTTGAVAGTTAVAAAGHGFADVGPAIAASQSDSTFSGTPVTPTFTGSATTPTFTGSSFGGGQPHSSVQPTFICNFIIRII